MRFIIGIQEGGLPFLTRDGLFKNTLDRAAFVAIIRNPIHPLTLGKGVVFSSWQ